MMRFLSSIENVTFDFWNLLWICGKLVTFCRKETQCGTAIGDTQSDSSCAVEGRWCNWRVALLALCLCSFRTPFWISRVPFFLNKSYRAHRMKSDNLLPVHGISPTLAHLRAALEGAGSNKLSMYPFVTRPVNPPRGLSEYADPGEESVSTCDWSHRVWSQLDSLLDVFDLNLKMSDPVNVLRLWNVLAAAVINRSQDLCPFAFYFAPDSRFQMWWNGIGLCTWTSEWSALHINILQTIDIAIDMWHLNLQKFKSSDLFARPPGLRSTWFKIYLDLCSVQWQCGCMLCCCASVLGCNVAAMQCNAMQCNAMHAQHHHEFYCTIVKYNVM